MSLMSSPDEQLVGKTLSGTYLLEKLLGAGGMGAVYRAKHLRTEGRLAIKILRPECASNPDLYRRFVNEARIVADLHHPFVAQVMDFDHDAGNGTSFIAMELLEGEDLSQRLAAVGRLPVEQALEIAYQVGSALLAAHGNSVVHRDIKPSNIFLVEHTMVDGAVQVAKVVDFGISKIRNSNANLTRGRTILGTPSYMAPEAAQGLNAEVDARVDQWALAIILYEALTGQHPFWTAAEQRSGTRPDEMAMLYRVVHDPHRPLIELMPKLPPHILAAIERALQKDKNVRFQSIADFVNALRGMQVPGLPVQAPRRRGGITLSLEDLHPLPPPVNAPPDHPTMSEHPQSRRRLWPMVAGLSIAMMLIMAGWIAWQTRQRGPHLLPHELGPHPQQVLPAVVPVPDQARPATWQPPPPGQAEPRDAGLEPPGDGPPPEPPKSPQTARPPRKVPAHGPQRDKVKYPHTTFDPES